ncbi:Outer membrane protein beta-barrel domain-containing protein [Marivirga sericea]|uniref:Outer membrane protein beta-barrel domain-containing protein n=1 Tax=Marivirga sericea TaxID=1028 RepID=A0A1X7KIA9_9BACT|nr:outer membrane beta-barrel protein [Marivirga sericea]SMG40312.1 Outer membrane protein beta-barrel domain-containing protein [Marivirga sericea]
MKNLIKISMIFCLGLMSHLASASGWNSDTLKVIQGNGEMVKIILNNIQNKQEVKAFNLTKIVESISENKDDLENAEILITGENKTYMLKQSGDYYYLSELSKKKNDRYEVRIFETSSRAELEKFKTEASNRGIDVTYENLQIINGKIDAITLKVDCNDGFSGTASTTNIPDSGIGFIRDYSEGSEVPFAIGKVFGNEEQEDEKDWKNDFKKEFNTAFNEEKVVAKDKNKFISHDHDVDFSIGLNNYLNSNNQFPDTDNKDFALDPLTSWTYGIHSNHKISVSPYLKFNFQLGLLWNNFALADNNYQFIKGPEQVELLNNDLARPDINPSRSKLNITYLNLNVVPMFHFGKSSNAFRIGAGPFGSYRIASKSKFKYDDNGKDVVKNNFHINNWKYGLKAQVGWKGVDLFATYDLSPVFIEDRGPEANYPLRAISFGVIF